MTSTSVTGITLKKLGKNPRIDQEPVRAAAAVDVQVDDRADVATGLVEQLAARQFFGGQ